MKLYWCTHHEGLYLRAKQNGIWYIVENENYNSNEDGPYIVTIGCGKKRFDNLEDAIVYCQNISDFLNSNDSTPSNTKIFLKESSNNTKN